MGKLRGIQIAGWKSIREMGSPLALGPINVLIGANGAGKSNLLSFFKFISESTEERLQALIGRWGGADSLLHRGSKQTPTMTASLEFEIKTSRNRHRYEIRLVPTAQDAMIFDDEHIISQFGNTAHPKSVHLSPWRRRSERYPRR